MKSYLTVLPWLITLAVLCGLACQPNTVAESAAEPEQACVLSSEQPAETVAEEIAEPVVPEPAAEVEQVETQPAPAPETAPRAPAVPAEAEETEPITPTSHADVAVTVNGVEVLESDIEARIKPHIERMAAQNKTMPPERIAEFKVTIRQRAVEGMIIESLLDKQAKEKNIEQAGEEEVTQEISQMAALRNMSVEQLQKMIEDRGQTLEDTKKYVRKSLTYQKLLKAVFADEFKVTEADAQKYYSENINRFQTPEQVGASHILIKPDTSDPNKDPNDAKATAMAKAQDLLKQVKDGADFAELAREQSDCPSASGGGDLGFGRKSDPASGRRGSWVPPFEKAAFTLEVGQTSDVVETRLGYHIIKVNGRKEAKLTTFDEAKEDIIKTIEQQKQNELGRNYIASLKAEAEIVYPPGKEPKPVQPRLLAPQVR